MTTHARRATEKKDTILETYTRTDTILDIQSHTTKALTLANQEAEKNPNESIEIYFMIRELREALIKLEILRQM